MRRRALPATLVAACAAALAGCVPSVPDVPPGARAQRPCGGGPNGEWLARDGRIELQAGGSRISARAVVRRQADGQVRLGLVSDEGVVLADLLTTPDGAKVERVLPELQQAVPTLVHAVRQAWATTKDDPRWVDGWLVGSAAGAERYYGGDPLALRRVSGGGPDLAIEDYRWEPIGLLAHEVRADGLGFSLRITIGGIGAPQPIAAAAASADPKPGAPPNGETW